MPMHPPMHPLMHPLFVFLVFGILSVCLPVASFSVFDPNEYDKLDGSVDKRDRGATAVAEGPGYYYELPPTYYVHPQVPSSSSSAIFASLSSSSTLPKSITAASSVGSSSPITALVLTSNSSSFVTSASSIVGPVETFSSSIHINSKNSVSSGGAASSIPPLSVSRSIIVDSSPSFARNNMTSFAINTVSTVSSSLKPASSTALSVTFSTGHGNATLSTLAIPSSPSINSTSSSNTSDIIATLFTSNSSTPISSSVRSLSSAPAPHYGYHTPPVSSNRSASNMSNIVATFFPSTPTIPSINIASTIANTLTTISVVPLLNATTKTDTTSKAIPYYYYTHSIINGKSTNNTSAIVATFFTSSSATSSVPSVTSITVSSASMVPVWNTNVKAYTTSPQIPYYGYYIPLASKGITNSSSTVIATFFTSTNSPLSNRILRTISSTVFITRITKFLANSTVPRTTLSFTNASSLVRTTITPAINTTLPVRNTTMIRVTGRNNTSIIATLVPSVSTVVTTTQDHGNYGYYYHTYSKHIYENSVTSSSNLGAVVTASVYSSTSSHGPALKTPVFSISPISIYSFNITTSKAVYYVPSAYNPPVYAHPIQNLSVPAKNTTSALTPFRSTSTLVVVTASPSSSSSKAIESTFSISNIVATFFSNIRTLASTSNFTFVSTWHVTRATTIGSISATRITSLGSISTRSPFISTSLVSRSTGTPSTFSRSTLIATTLASHSMIIPTTFSRSTIVDKSLASPATSSTSQLASIYVYGYRLSEPSSIGVSVPIPYASDGRCGAGTDFTCEGSPYGSCCSKYGWCGESAYHCTHDCQSDYGSCSSSKFSPDGTCGGANGFICNDAVGGNCCSQDGWCGNSAAYCAEGCNTAFSGIAACQVYPQSSNNGRCGKSVGLTCAGGIFDGACCSQYGYCGTTVAHCRSGCAKGWGKCD